MHSVEEDLSPIQSFIKIFLKRWWYVVICLATVMGPIAWYNRTATPVYEAVTTIIYEKPRVPVNPALPYEYQSKESLLNRIQEIKSRSVAMEIVAALPKDVLSRIPLPKNRDADFDARNFYAAKIRRNIHASPVAESDVIQIKITASNNFVAMSIANVLTEVLDQRNLRIRQEEVSGVRSFIEDQRENYATKLDETEANLRSFKEKNQVTSLDKEVEEVLRRITQIDAIYQETKANLDKTEERLKTIDQKISSQQENLVPGITDVSTPLVQQLKEDLKNKRAQLIGQQLQGVPESNPKMVNMREDIERISKELTQEAMKIVSADNVIDPLSQISVLYQEKINLELELETLRTQGKSLSTAISGYEKKLQQLPSKEFELAKLTREKDLANSIFVMLSQKREEARISEAEKLGTMRVIDKADLPLSPIRPKKKLNLALGLLLGLTMGIGLVFFLETMDISIKTPEEVERKVGLQILGSIPSLKVSGKTDSQNGERNYRQPSKRLVTYSDPASAASEAYRALRTNLQFTDKSEKISVFMFTSSGPREGKSTTVANLAVTTAQMGLKTLVIDADLRKPTLHRFFGLHREPGLANILSYFFHKNQFKSLDEQPKDDDDNGSNGSEDSDILKQASIRARKAVHDIASLDLALNEAVQPSNIRGLDILTCGELPLNPSEMLASETMKDLLALVKERYEFVLIDAPPIIAVTDAAVVEPNVDGAILVVESGRNDKEIIQKAKALLDRGGIRFLGAILNNIKEKNLYGDYNYYYTYYSQRSHHSEKHRKK